MAISITFNTIDGEYILDETPGLQTGTDPTLANDGDDVPVGSLPSTFSNYLFTAAGLNLPSTFPGNVGVAASASDLIKVSSDGSLSSFGLTDADGGVLDGESSGFSTAAGDAIFLWSALDGKVVYGKTAGGEIAFAVYLEAGATVAGSTDAKLWSVTFTAIEHDDPADHDDPVDLLENVYVTATGAQTFNFDSLPSGQNLFGMVGDLDNGIVVIGQLPVLKTDGTFTNTSDTINSSKGGGPTTIGIDNQSFDPIGGNTNVDDGAFFTYVSDPKPAYLAGAQGGLTQNEADDADNIQFGGTKEVHGAFLKVVQVVGNGPASMRLTAFNIDTGSTLNTTSPDDDTAARDFVEGDMGNADDKVGIINVWVYDGVRGGPLLASYGANANGIIITIVDGVVEITGLPDNSVVEWATSSVHDQVLVQAITGSSPFDIGLFGITEGAKDTVSAAGHAFVEDDGPAIGAIADSNVKFAPGETSGDVALYDVPGTDGQETLEITSFTASVALTGVTLTGVRNAAKTEVEYFNDKDGDGVRETGETHYYTLSITQNALTGDNYRFDVIDAPAAPPLEFSFDGLPSGQNLFGMVADSEDVNGAAVLFFAANAVINDPGNGEFTNTSGTINTSKGGGPTTIGHTNQMIDKDEAIYFTIVNNAGGVNNTYLANVTGGLNQNEADDADNMVFEELREVPGAFFKVSQTQGNEVEACTVEAFNIDKPAVGDERDILTASGQGKVDVIKVSIYSGAPGPEGTLLEETVGGADGGTNEDITVSITDGVATIIGLEAGYYVVWETDGDHDQVRITGTAGKFDIGSFGLSEPQETPDHSLLFEVTLTDGDGDSAKAGFQINIDGDDDGNYDTASAILPLSTESMALDPYSTLRLSDWHLA